MRKLELAMVIALLAATTTAVMADSLGAGVGSAGVGSSGVMGVPAKGSLNEDGNTAPAVGGTTSDRVGAAGDANNLKGCPPLQQTAPMGSTRELARSPDCPGNAVR